VITLTCIEKIRNKSGVTETYILEDMLGQKLEMSRYRIKRLMYSGLIEVTNLKLDKANRIIDKNEKH